MAKKEIDSFVEALIGIKGLISTIKPLSNAIAFDPESELVYLSSESHIHDMFVILTDPNVINSSKKFTFHIINTVNAVAFNKALKKTKTVSDILDDKAIKFTTDGYYEFLIMPPLVDYTDMTKTYQKLFKDKDLTKLALNTISSDYSDWYKIDVDKFEQLKQNNLVVVESSTGNPMYLSKAIFGNIKKTLDIYHTTIQVNDNNEVVIFKQVEKDFCIYHILRFLLIE